MSFKQFDRAFWETQERFGRLKAARERCVIYSAEYWAIDEQITAALDKLASCSKATSEACGMKYTNCGDFTHLGAVGSVSF
ncbi:MAG: hypothetical protein [Caudoviricetes sp.]|nr:MAG: hypothetical protein [Caudoviricetes sp.]